MSRHDSRLASVVLFAGIAVGAALAAAGILKGAPDLPTSLDDDAVAVVGDQPIRRLDYERALRAVAADRRGRLGPSEERRVLQRLIDEELLVQHGVELGLARRDPRLRAELSAAVIGLVVAGAEMEAADPEEETLRAFYGSRIDLFREAPRYRVEHLYVAVDGRDGEAEARTRARALAGRLVAGEEVGGVAEDADPFVGQPPDGWLAAGTLRDYLGPSVARAVEGLEEGGVSEPIRSSGGYHVVRLVELRPGRRRPYDEVRAEVRAAYRRQAGEQALEAFLEEQRRIVPIEVTSEP